MSGSNQNIKWTKETPKVEGWYWRRWIVGDGVIHQEIAYIDDVGGVVIPGMAGSHPPENIYDSEWWPEKINDPA